MPALYAKIESPASLGIYLLIRFLSCLSSQSSILYLQPFCNVKFTTTLQGGLARAILTRYSIVLKAEKMCLRMARVKNPLGLGEEILSCASVNAECVQQQLQYCK